MRIKGAKSLSVYAESDFKLLSNEIFFVFFLNSFKICRKFFHYIIIHSYGISETGVARLKNLLSPANSVTDAKPLFLPKKLYRLFSSIHFMCTATNHLAIIESHLNKSDTQLRTHKKYKKRKCEFSNIFVIAITCSSFFLKPDSTVSLLTFDGLVIALLLCASKNHT